MTLRPMARLPLPVNAEGDIVLVCTFVPHDRWPAANGRGPADLDGDPMADHMAVVVNGAILPSFSFEAGGVHDEYVQLKLEVKLHERYGQKMQTLSIVQKDKQVVPVGFQGELVVQLMFGAAPAKLTALQVRTRQPVRAVGRARRLARSQSTI